MTEKVGFRNSKQRILFGNSAHESSNLENNGRVHIWLPQKLKALCYGFKKTPNSYSIVVHVYPPKLYEWSNPVENWLRSYAPSQASETSEGGPGGIGSEYKSVSLGVTNQSSTDFNSIIPKIVILSTFRSWCCHPMWAQTIVSSRHWYGWHMVWISKLGQIPILMPPCNFRLPPHPCWVLTWMKQWLMVLMSKFYRILILMPPCHMGPPPYWCQAPIWMRHWHIGWMFKSCHILTF